MSSHPGHRAPVGVLLLEDVLDFIHPERDQRIANSRNDEWARHGILALAQLQFPAQADGGCGMAAEQKSAQRVVGGERKFRDRLRTLDDALDIKRRRT
jgi:hypothetical protein